MTATDWAALGEGGGSVVGHTPTGVPIIACDTCGRRHPTTVDHCETCGMPSRFPHHVHRPDSEPIPPQLGQLTIDDLLETP